MPRVTYSDPGSSITINLTYASQTQQWSRNATSSQPIFIDSSQIDPDQRILNIGVKFSPISKITNTSKPNSTISLSAYTVASLPGLNQDGLTIDLAPANQTIEGYLRGKGSMAIVRMPLLDSSASFTHVLKNTYGAMSLTAKYDNLSLNYSIFNGTSLDPLSITS